MFYLRQRIKKYPKMNNEQLTAELNERFPNRGRVVLERQVKTQKGNISV